MLKEPNNWLPSRALSQYRAKTHQRDSRHNNDLTLPRYRLATPGQKIFIYSGAKLYNCIAKDIRDTGNLNAFKKRIFKYLFNSWIVFFIIEMYIVLKINVLLLSLLFIEIRYFITEM